jgi:hypothetical protein
MEETNYIKTTLFQVDDQSDSYNIPAIFSQMRAEDKLEIKSRITEASGHTNEMQINEMNTFITQLHKHM